MATAALTYCTPEEHLALERLADRPDGIAAAGHRPVHRACSSRSHATVPHLAASDPGNAKTLVQGMTIVRAIFAAGLLLLGGCASAVQQQDRTGILRPRPRILHINGTFEPVVFVVNGSKGQPVETRPPCQTNDPMPVSGLRHTPPPIPTARTASPVAPMPNFCPVILAAAPKSTRVSAPRPPGQLQPPTPTEPQP